MIMELMKYNFIIVQHFAPLDMAEQCEGNRLRSFYNVDSFPYIAIINPLPGGEVKRMSRSSTLTWTALPNPVCVLLSFENSHGVFVREPNRRSSLHSRSLH